MKNIHRKYDSMPASSPFIGGYTGQNPVDRQTAENIGQYSVHFDDGFPDSDGDRKFSEEDKLMRQRARKANRIYRQVCEDLQLDACFFGNFGEWSEYVEGRMSDDEFHGCAVNLAHNMLAALN